MRLSKAVVRTKGSIRDYPNNQIMSVPKTILVLRARAEFVKKKKKKS